MRIRAFEVSSHYNIQGIKYPGVSSVTDAALAVEATQLCIGCDQQT